MGKRLQPSVIVAIFAFFAVLLLFSSLSVANAQESADSLISGSVDASKFVPSSSLTADSDQEMSKDGSRVAMFRLYNKWTGEHFYTSSISERDKITKDGWKQEGVGWYAPTSKDMKPVYRLYNKYVQGGDHHYTTSSDEKDACVKAGWTYEGEGWRTVDATTSAETDVASVLRQYNPYAATGTHNYTTSKEEQDNLVKAGWKAEGVGWAGYSKLEPTSSDSSTLQAFAVYSADDSSLDFYKRETVPSEGSKFNGKTATKVFTGFETTVKNPPAWSTYLSQIKAVTVVDTGIHPVSMYGWFACTKQYSDSSFTYISNTIENFTGLEKLDTSKTLDMSYLFYLSTKTEEINGISDWDTSNVTKMNSMFAGCRKLESIPKFV